jgi:hypothetical protein
MPSSYTANGGIELPANGEQSGTWGETVNDNMSIIDRLTNGVGSISLSGTTHTLTTNNGSLSEGQYKVLIAWRIAFRHKHDYCKPKYRAAYLHRYKL